MPFETTMICAGKEKVKLFRDRIVEALLPKEYAPKVFCIGYNKTGTTSLGKSLELLGFRHSSFNRRVWRELYLKGRIDRVIDYTAKFESFDDLPWLKEDMIPYLYNSFPGSKFIYLERDEESWEKSYERWTLQMFGYSKNAEEEWGRYTEHRDFVHSYFADEKSFITLDIKDEKGLKKLASFLCKEAPQDHFPQFNKS